MYRLWFFLLILPMKSASASSGITYHGRLLKPNATPVTSSSVQFRVQVRTPGTEDCLMYEEIQTLNLSTTDGVFSLNLGDGSGVRQDSYAWSLFDAFSNRRIFNFSAGDCTGINSYDPGDADNRKFRVYFNDGSFSGWEALPVQTINFIPMSIESYAVGGFPASSLLRVETAGVLGTTTPLTSAQYGEILNLAAGTSSLYQQNGELNGSVLPPLGGGESFRSDGSGGWQAFTPLTVESDPTVQAFAKASLPTCVTGEVLKSDGSVLSCVTDTSGTLPDVGVAGTYTKVITDAKGRVTSGSQITGSDITSGTIGGSAAIATTGDIAADQISAHGLYLSNLEPKTISILPPASITPVGGYTLTLPVDDGTSGQVLSTDGSGTLSWISPSTGSVTNVTGTSPIVVATGSTTPVISLDDSGVGAATYGSATQVPVIAVDSKGRVTSASNTTISGVSPVGSTLSTGKVWVGSSNAAQERFLGISDIRSTAPGNAAIFPLSCTNAQTMVWKSPDDVFECTNISITNTQVSGLTASNISNTTAGNLSSTNVQASLEELDSDLSSLNTTLSMDISEKIAKAGDTMSGNLDMDGNQILNIANVPFVSTNPTGTEDGQTLRWNNGTSKWEWFSPGVSGVGVTSINSLTGQSQTLTTAISGTTPAFVSAGSTHTLNIPLASSASVTAGLISKTDYDNFNGKLGTGLVNGNIWIGNSSGQATAHPISGDASLDNTGKITVTKIQSTPVSAAAPSGAGQILKYNGSSQYEPAYFGITDLKDGSGNAQFPSGLGSMATENASDYLTKSGNLSGLANTTTARTNLGLGDAALKTVGTSSGNLVQLDGSGRFPASTLPLSGYDDTYFKQNGNSFGTSATLGTNDVQALNLETNNATRMTITSNGNVGIGAASPTHKLEVNGNIYASGNGASYTTSGWAKSYELPNGGVTMWKKGTATYSRGIGKTGDVMYFMRSTADDGSAAPVYDMVINSSGNVGIGTTSPATLLDVSGMITSDGVYSAHDGTAVSVYGYNNGANYGVRGYSAGNYGVYGSSGSASYGGVLGYSQDGSVFGILGHANSYSFYGSGPAYVIGAVTSSTSGYGFVQTDGTTTLRTWLGGSAWIGTTTMHGLQLGANGGTAITMTVPGNVGIGTTMPSYKLHVNGSVAGVGAYNALSDRRFKAGIRPIENPIEKIMKLQGVRFNWKQEQYPQYHFDRKEDIGVIAQDVEKVLPEAVTTGSDGVKTVAYAKLVAPLIEATKEIYGMCQINDREIAALKEENALLKKRLDRLEKTLGLME